MTASGVVETLQGKGESSSTFERSRPFSLIIEVLVLISHTCNFPPLSSSFLSNSILLDPHTRDTAQTTTTRPFRTKHQSSNGSRFIQLGPGRRDVSILRWRVPIERQRRTAHQWFARPRHPSGRHRGELVLDSHGIAPPTPRAKSTRRLVHMESFTATSFWSCRRPRRQRPSPRARAERITCFHCTCISSYGTLKAA